MFYNTIGATGPTLETYQYDAQTQDEAIMALFNRNPTATFTASEVHHILYSETKVPLTSVRRTLSGFYKANKIVKLTGMREGYYGKPEHAWRLLPKP